MNTTKQTKSLAAAGLAAGILALSACSSDVEDNTSDFTDISLSYVSFITPDNPQSHAFEAWAEEVSERTDGAVQFDMHYAGSLCSFEEIMECVGSGTADLGFASASSDRSRLPLSTLADVAFVTDDIAAMPPAFVETFNDSEDLQQEWEDANIERIYSAGATPDILGTSDELDSFDDLQGLSLRVAGDRAAAFSIAGVNPTSMSMPESYEAIERGVVSGVVTSLDGFVDTRLYEVAGYVYDTGEYQGNGSLWHTVMNKSTWDSLSSETQDVMSSVAQEIQQDYVSDFLATAVESECEILEDNGAVVQGLGPQDAGETWATESREVLQEEWTEFASGTLEDPEELFELYLTHIESHEGDDPFAAASTCRQ